MGFGGATSAMISSLKNNKRSRKSAFEKLDKYQKDKNSKLFFDKTASEEQLAVIRHEIRRKNTRSFIKNTIAIVLLLIALFYVIGFVNF